MLIGMDSQVRMPIILHVRHNETLRHAGIRPAQGGHLGMNPWRHYYMNFATTPEDTKQTP